MTEQPESGVLLELFCPPEQAKALQEAYRSGALRGVIGVRVVDQEHYRRSMEELGMPVLESAGEGTGTDVGGSDAPPLTWREFALAHPPGSTVVGVVERIGTLGVHVSLGENLTGMFLGQGLQETLRVGDRMEFSVMALKPAEGLAGDRIILGLPGAVTRYRYDERGNLLNQASGDSLEAVSESQEWSERPVSGGRYLTQSALTPELQKIAGHLARALADVPEANRQGLIRSFILQAQEEAAEIEDQRRRVRFSPN